MQGHRSFRGLLAVALGSSIFTQFISAAPLPNAWQITDNSSAGGSTNYYATNLSSALQIAATNSPVGFRFVVNARCVTNFNDSHTMVMSYGLGSSRFLIWFHLNSSNDLTAELEGGLTYTLTTNGTGAALYHTHEMKYDRVAGAAYLFDGGYVTNGWPGSANDSPAGRVSWGASSSGGRAQMNFHRVTFLVTNAVVANYDAGIAGNPAIAPNPTNNGWTRFPSVQPANTSVTNVSPDSVPNTAMLPIVATLPPSQLTNSSARLNGQVNARGSLTKTWFEWGTDTNYGNTTPAQDVGQSWDSANTTNVLGGLLGGPDYHYRAVGSNFYGVVKGEDSTFNVRFLRNQSLQELSAFPGNGPVSTSAGDFNNDGWLDLLILGPRVPESTGGASMLLQNNGNGTFSDVTAALAPGLPQIVGKSAWGDFDNDGRLDFLMVGRTNLEPVGICQLWRNTGSGFTNVPISGLPTNSFNVLGSLTIGWRDFDNDGRLDFVLQSGSLPRVLQWWRNTGSGFTNVPNSGPSALFSYASLAWADYNNDGLADMFVAGSTNTTSTNKSGLWRNTGASFTWVPLAGGPLDVLETAAAFGDYDSDGWLDLLFAGDPPGGNLPPFYQLWRNTNGGFTNVPIPGLRVGLRGMISWGDYNNDGRLDFVIAGETNNLSYTSQLWENTSNGFNQITVGYPDDPAGFVGYTEGSLVMADVDRDGRLDILISGRGVESENQPLGYGPRLFRNNMAVGSNQPPAAPTALFATVTGTRANLHWTAPSDDHTPSVALSYNVRIGTTPGGCDVVSPPALPDGRLTLPQIGPIQNGAPAFYDLPPGNYYWSVQAVDGGLAGSPFAAEQQFTIGPRLIQPLMLGNGQFQFSFTNNTSAIYEVLGTTNVALPLDQWSLLAPPIPLGSGLYQFTDLLAPSHPQRFYLLRAQ